MNLRQLLQGLGRLLKLFWNRRINAAILVVGPGQPIILSRKESQMYTLPVDMKVPITIKGLDRAGNEAPLESIVFSVDKPELVLIVLDDALPQSAVLEPTAVGTFQLRVDADARIGEEVKMITGLLDVEVVAGEAVSIGITPGEQVPKE